MYTASVHGRKRPCTWLVLCRVHEPVWPVHGRIHHTLHGRVDGRFRPCIWPVHGRVHGPYMAVYTSRVWGRVRTMYTAEDVGTDDPYTVMYTGGVDGPCARPIHGRVRAVYRARPLYGRVRAVFAGEDVFIGPCTRPPCNWHTTRYTAVYTARTRPHNGRLHGHGRPVHGRVTAV